MQLGQLQKIEQQLHDMGYQIIGLSPDRPEALAATLEKNSLKYSLFSDPGLTAARGFGVAFRVNDEGRQLPVPAVFLVRTDGSITFMYANPDYKVRLDPDLLLAAAKAEAVGR